MRFKTEVSTIVEKIDTLLEATQNSMNKRVISADEVFKNLTTARNDLERAQALINREPDN